ncbi:hypothetical protein MM1S1540310_0706 [Mycobacteroides abscessus subsp. bolletii 1S-154-0310]|uniref:Uncharacterized protein n=1 Tax=Mycobacteroides abscessus subsp. bolletii 1513 TaxID=1299321 RepID=X8DLZ1_9MYCO|nr:hypothetical protein MM1S1510930_1148 [Mycobacteroides abscessus subsp. bolletii 1S-151-0930]EIU67154.1 hypothetical protein MM1S1520914_1355 [Mycobacteroides abscessus subsp. bolletii 1S-152-0914]EIU81769.1 hypothetical protein MM1S1530915_0692 [Mycobacteroides abscessus subsp. bolletii 1S-153-0915]EIU84487.1 hypothetical protein MM1S1540310_0706 [Mycobacteroides abscessus subsp. bolletii 1S-154-0310]EIV14712.1 hypothetical protein MM2B0912R_1476 [Mycobacteroides abscessus subsp. bolletii 2
MIPELSGHVVGSHYRPHAAAVANPCEIPVNTRIYTWKSY